MTGPVIAVDGPAGAGKSSVARELAARLEATHVDTGAMYRAFALKALRTPGSLEDSKKVAELLGSTEIVVGDGKVLLDGENVARQIRSAEVTAASSRVAEVPAVRTWMVDRQRALAAQARGAVMEGRDIGTVVLPDAELKIYLTASEKERARRRSIETGAETGQTAAEMAARDARDSNRAVSPLKPAEDAVVLDTTGLNIEQVVAKVLEILALRRDSNG